MRVSDWSSDVCSSDLIGTEQANNLSLGDRQRYIRQDRPFVIVFGDGHDRQPAGLRLCGQGGFRPVYDAKIVHSRSLVSPLMLTWSLLIKSKRFQCLQAAWQDLCMAFV